MDTFKSFNDAVNSQIGWIHDNNYIAPILVLILCLYVTLVRPELPKYIEKLFENFFFRLIVLSFIVYKANNDIQTSILLTFSFLFIMHTINSQRIDKCINE
jgi:hypothetical protein